MKDQNYITSHCKVTANHAYQNGKLVTADKSLSPTDFFISVYKELSLNYSRFYKMDNLSKLGWLASELLLKDGFNKAHYKPEEIGMVLSNANSSLDNDKKYMDSVSDIPSPALFVYTLPNIVIGEICIRNNFKGEHAFYLSEKFDAAFLEQQVSYLLNNNLLQACICGWVDFSGNDYKAVLFLAEKENKGQQLVFNADNMNELFEAKQPERRKDDDIFIAGIGVISAIGNNVQENLDAFRNSAAGLGDITRMDTLHKGRLPVGEVNLSDMELAVISGLPKSASRTTLLSAIAAGEALADAKIPELASWRTGFVSANTVGGMDKSQDFLAEYLKDNAKGKLKDVYDHECGSITQNVADHLGIKDYITTISTACSSSANAIFSGARLIKNNILDIVVAGGTDALTKFTLNGFNTLMILDKEFCKPFDEDREGLNLGEGAGYVVLVSAKVAKALQHIYCKLSGYHNSNDAYHQTASSPDGVGSYMAMKGALERSGLAPKDIDYINLHGTGTPNNDSSEGAAITRLFEKDFPLMSSTKSFTGHTLGASGGMEAVFSILAIANGTVFPNLRFKKPMHDLPVVPESRLLSGLKLRNVLSNSFGFGGNCTSLIFSAI